jgi:hypothetical protein
MVHDLPAIHRKRLGVVYASRQMKEAIAQWQSQSRLESSATRRRGPYEIARGQVKLERPKVRRAKEARDPHQAALSLRRLAPMLI